MSISNHVSGDSNVELQSRESISTGNRIQGKGRLIALDAVRGLAVIGMFIQHFALNQTNASIVSGNTTLLFVLCGGISYTIMARRMEEQGLEPRAFRARMLSRSVFINIIGYFLILLNTPFGVILPAYAVMFLLALVLVRRETRVIVAVAVGLLVVSPPLMLLGLSLFSGAYLLSDVAGGPMSAVALAPAFVIGMAIGRINLEKTCTLLFFVGGGIIMLVISKLISIYLLPGLSLRFEEWLISNQGNYEQPDPDVIWPLNTQSVMWHMLLWDSPHSASTFQTMTGLGAALLALGLICLIAKKAEVILMPLAAVGRVALTMYAVQFVIVWGFELAGMDIYLAEMPFGDLLVAVVTILLAWLIAKLPAGPLEGNMRRFDQVFSGILSVK